MNEPIETTIDLISMMGINEGSKLHELVKKLNVGPLNDWRTVPPESIMHYKMEKTTGICEHDDGYLCEHRLQILVDFIKNNFTEN